MGGVLARNDEINRKRQAQLLVVEQLLVREEVNLPRSTYVSVLESGARCNPVSKRLQFRCHVCSSSMPACSRAVTVSMSVGGTLLSPNTVVARQSGRDVHVVRAV